MLKVLLAYRCSAEGAANPFERVLPVGLGYVHSYLRRAGVPVVLANLSGMRPGRIREILLAERPDLIGISCFTFNRSASLDLARLVKRTLPGSRVVLGGPHATHAGPALMEQHPEVDLCVAGEGELTLDRIVSVLSEGSDPGQIRGIVLRKGGSVVSTPPAEPIADLDALPFPALYPEGYGVDPRAQYPYVVTSRGCPAKCTFCSSPEFWGSGVRFRSAQNILDELELLRTRFGILYVSFRDDIFTLNKARIIALCRGLVERRLSLLWDCQTRVNTIDEERLIWMKRAGGLILQYGIESGSQKVLDQLRKGQTLEAIDRAALLTRKVGLILSVYLISGVPGESEQDLLATEEMIRRIRPHDGIVTPLAVFPGTQLWDEYRSAQEIGEDFWESVGHDGVYVRPDRFTEGALMRLSALLEAGSAQNAYTPAEFAEHRRVTGECYAADLMEGESLERAGQGGMARTIYARLAAREPWNPWPLLRLGGLAVAAKDRAAAERHLTSVLELVPESMEAQTLLSAARQTGPSRRREASTTHSRRRSSRPSRAYQAYPPPYDMGGGGKA